LVSDFFEEFIHLRPAYIHNRSIGKKNARHGFVHCLAVVKVNNVAAVYIAKALHGKKFSISEMRRELRKGFFVFRQYILQ
jgi:hypothetical protein